MMTKDNGRVGSDFHLCIFTETLFYLSHHHHHHHRSILMTVFLLHVVINSSMGTFYIYTGRIGDGHVQGVAVRLGVG